MIAEGQLSNIKVSEQALAALEEAKEYMLSFITDGILREKTKLVLDEYWSILIRIAASKTGRYHHKHEQVIPGGLINHKIRGLWFLLEILKEEGIKDQSIINEMVSAMATHDIGKIYYYEPYKSNRPSKSKNWRVDHGLEAFHILKGKFFPDSICNMVKRHMHHWDWHIPQCLNERLIAYADYFASRENVDIRGLKIIKVKGDGRVLFEAPKYKPKGR